MKNRIIIFLSIFIVTIFGTTLVNASSLSNDDYMNYIKRNESMLELSNKVEQEMLKYNKEYPSYYGGMYIGDTATNLVLQIVKKNIPDTQSNDFSSYEKIIKMSDAITIEYVDNSYTELKNVYEQINNYYKAVDYKVAKAEFNEYSAHYVDVKSNSVVVSVYDNNAKAKSVDSEMTKQSLATKFKKEVLNTNIIKFENGQKLENEANQIKAGQGISVPGGTCSEGGKVDAAFVQTTSSYEPLNTLANPKYGITKLNNTMCPFLRVGSAIAHDGVTSGYQSGTIKSLNYSGNFDGIAFTNLITADYVSAGGDSGGPVFVPSSNGEGLVAGIHKGSVNSNTKVFVNADNIYAAFGYSRY